LYDTIFLADTRHIEPNNNVMKILDLYLKNKVRKTH